MITPSRIAELRALAEDADKWTPVDVYRDDLLALCDAASPPAALVQASIAMTNKALAEQMAGAILTRAPETTITIVTDDALSSPELPEIGCADCGRPYDKGPDLVVSNADWLRIAPHDGNGLLCPNCMNDRFAALGATNVKATFTSGPFAMEKSK